MFYYIILVNSRVTLVLAHVFLSQHAWLQRILHWSCATNTTMELLVAGVFVAEVGVGFDGLSLAKLVQVLEVEWSPFTTAC